MEIDGLLRLKQVVNLTGISRSEIYRRMAKGKFPRQYRISTGIAVWRQSDIASWIGQAVNG